MTRSRQIIGVCSLLFAGGLLGDSGLPEPAATLVPCLPEDCVDLFIGTAGDHGQLHPAAAVPFGMIQLGPETLGNSHSGYDFNATEILGFSHNRSSGVGCRGAGGNLLVRVDYDQLGNSPQLVDKSSEHAEPGYYRVGLVENDITVEMTAAEAVGFQRYSFNRPGDVWITLDSSHAHHKSYASDIRAISAQQWEGSVTAATVCDEGLYQAYFSIRASVQPEEVIKLDDQRVAMRYEILPPQQLQLQTAFSTVSAEDAALRLDRVSADFNDTRRAAKDLWRERLSRFEIEGEEEKRILFYSHLYRIYLSPYRIARQGEPYRGSDDTLYSADKGDHFFGWSTWDTFRTKFPLLTLTDPSEMAAITASLATLYEHGKVDWSTTTEPYINVRSEHASIILLDAWRKGIREIDAQNLLPALSAEADSLATNTPDKALETAYDHWAVSNFAQDLGLSEIANKHAEAARSYRQLWQDKFKVMRENADVMHGDGLYEGTLWQYRWFVPFDTQWLLSQFDGAEGFARELDTFFQKEYFNIGNQPDIQAPFMFNIAGKPWMTQGVVYDLLNTEQNHWYGTHEKKEEPYYGLAFRAEPEAFIPEMDDDDGTMSGWFVFATMGLYPITPGDPRYSLHTPSFEKLTLAFDSGKSFVITTSDPELPYIQSAKLNGQPINRAWLAHQEIVSGGTLEIVTQAAPNIDWGIDHPFETSIQ